MLFSNGKEGSSVSQVHEKISEGRKWQFPSVIGDKFGMTTNVGKHMI